MDILDIERRYDQSSSAYDRHDALEREIGGRLLERAAFARLAPTRILDIGCGTGHGTQALKKRFEEATVIGLDLSRRMLQRVQEGSTEAAPLLAVQADLTRLPLAARRVDLAFCNLSLQWAGDFEQALREIRRVLTPEGMLLFSVPGPDSLRELRALVGQGASASMPIYMPDLQEVGDLLVSAGFSEPVMDNEMVTLSFPDPVAMQRELAVTGAAGFARLPAPPPAERGVEVGFEIVYGTAFGAPEGRPVRSGEGEVATFSVELLRKK